MSILFTADTHFFHRAQVAYRGFDSVEAMNGTLVADWNRNVGSKDTVFHLGDLSFGTTAETVAILNRLHGTINIVPGNHDEDRHLERMSRLQVLPPLVYRRFNIHQPDGTDIVHRFSLCHFPMLVWKNNQYGSIHLHGHSHGNLNYPKGLELGRILDVGVDATRSYTGHWGPIRLVQVLRIMNERQYVAFDHHREKTHDQEPG